MCRNGALSVSSVVFYTPTGEERRKADYLGGLEAGGRRLLHALLLG